MSAAAALVTLAIHARDIDRLLACEGGADYEGNFAAAALRDLLRSTRVRVLLVAVILFHLASGAMLPLVGEIFSADQSHTGQTYMSACILISQLVMLPIAVVAGRLGDRWGRKPTLLVGFAVLPFAGCFSPRFAIPTRWSDPATRRRERRHFRSCSSSYDR